jgi:hypothetical protein
MKHLNLDQLLSLQGGEELPEAEAHLNACPSCAGERELLEHRQRLLRDLRLVRPANDGWPRIRAAIDARKRRRKAMLIGIAVAAALLVLAPFVGSRSQKPATGAAELAELIKVSQGLEEKLRSVPDPEMLDFRSAELMVDLEEQIGLVDQCIGELGGGPEDRDELSMLWQTRIELLQTLVNLRSPMMALASWEGPSK